MDRNTERCTCYFCGSEKGKPYKYYTATAKETVSTFRGVDYSGEVNRFSGVKEYTAGVCQACRFKKKRVKLLIGVACLVVSIMILTFSRIAALNAALSYVLFAGIILTIIGVIPADGSKMLVDEARKKNPDLHYLTPRK